MTTSTVAVTSIQRGDRVYSTSFGGRAVVRSMSPDVHIDDQPACVIELDKPVNGKSRHVVPAGDLFRVRGEPLSS